MFKLNTLNIRSILKTIKCNQSGLRFKSANKALKNEYQDTLNLPNPGEFGLSMKNICKTEDKIRKIGNFDTLYKWQVENRKDRPVFHLHDGPPYANGDIHIGHMVNKVLKDIFLRYKLVAGYQINYAPGWDCHGLPIELNAVKSLNTKAKKSKSGSPQIQFTKSDPLDIRRYAGEYAKECIQTQMSSFKELNLLVDWSSIYRTIDVDYMCKELDLFYELYEKKLIYRDYMPVYWSVSSQTALAEFELEYKADHKSDSVFVEYELVKYSDQVKSLLGNSEQKLYAPIWTTTPWSLPANKAIAFSPTLKYGILNNASTNKAYIVATDLIEETRKTIPSFQNTTVMDVTLDGSDLSSSFYSNPFNPNNVQPVLSSDHVGSKTGTGLVHIAPALGQDDFKLAIKHKLATECVVNELGQYDVSDPVLREFKLCGLSVLDKGTNERIKEILGESLLHSHVYTHSYPYDWRTKKPCIIRSSMQWFIDTGRLKGDSLDKLKDVKIRPGNATNAMNSTLSLRPYWCISRQRSWGLPIPCVYSKEGSGNTAQAGVVTKELIESVKAMIVKEGNADFWWTNKYDQELMKAAGVESKEFSFKSKDIFDIWFDSGCSFNSVLGKTKQADVYCEGVDQFSGWFQSSLLLSIGLNQQAPYKNILVHGFVVDEQNHKMSKSVGNVIEPRQAIRGIQNKLPECGLDTLRFWVAHEYYKPHIQIGKGILEKFLKRTFEIRSVLRFVTGNLNDLDKTQLLPYESLLPIDKYILHQLSLVLKQAVLNYEDMSLNKSIISIENFFLTQVSSLYVNSVRDRLYCEARSSLERRSSQTALYHVLTKSLALLGPILPHLSEEAFQHCPILKQTGDSLFRSNEVLDLSADPNWSNEEVSTLFSALSHIRAAFYEEIQSEKMSVYEVNVECSQSLFDLIQSAGMVSDSWLTELFGCSKVQYSVASDQSKAQTLKINEVEYSFRLEASKNQQAFVCSRCRRYTSMAENALCQRCSEVLKSL